MARALKLPALKPKVPSPFSSRLPKLPDPSEPDVFEEMTLLEHMEELRDRIIKSVIAIGVAFVAGVFLAGPLLKRLQIEATPPPASTSSVRPTRSPSTSRSPSTLPSAWRYRSCSGR